MLSLLLGIGAAGLTLMAISLRKVYHHVPAKELKRSARQGDEFAALLYKAAAYGGHLELTLWLIIGVSAASFFVLLSRSLPAWLALLGSMAVLWFGFAWLPSSPKVTRLGTYIARIFTPPLSALLNFMHPIVARLAGVLRRIRPVTIHTGLYQKEDLLELIEHQKVQADNRITEEELRIASHALTFGDRTISQIMTPRRAIKTVSADETVGPVLMDELHASGYSRFPVLGNRPEDIVGTLFLRDLMRAKKGGHVSTVMDKQVYYVNEELPVEHALQAFLKTKHHLFIVVNEFEEIVGVVTIEDVLEQIIGRHIVDEFDQYDDLRAVAKKAAARAAEDNNHIDQPSDQQDNKS